MSGSEIGGGGGWVPVPTPKYDLPSATTPSKVGRIAAVQLTSTTYRLGTKNIYGRAVEMDPWDDQSLHWARKIDRLHQIAHDLDAGCMCSTCVEVLNIAHTYK